MAKVTLGGTINTQGTKEIDPTNLAQLREPAVITSRFWDEKVPWNLAGLGTQFFKKSKKRSETRFGTLLRSSGRLVLFSGESEHFFFRQKFAP